ncbi:MAG: glycosyltransferase family 2 protein [Bacteroidales bacterium]|nr:glycosyltransferase family 2 protein [Bacteroidales bacterium]
MPTLSIVVSVYNEEAVLPQFHKELTAALATLDDAVEIIYVDDGSADGSRAILDSLATDIANIRAIHFSRNFGHEAAMIAGIDHAMGDAVVCMDADLQNPPAELAKMLDLYRQGYDIVTMVREDRADGGWTKRVTSKLFYRLMNRMSDTYLMPDASDFFLLSRRVCEVLRTDYRERSRLLRGMVQTVGFRTTSLTYKAPARAAGQSHYSLARLTRLALTSMASFSKAPLRLGIYAGLLFVFLSAVLLVYSLVMWIIDRPVGGYTTLIIFLSAFAGILLTVVGIIGYYVGLVLDEVKGRPIYIVESITEESKQ